MNSIYRSEQSMDVCWGCPCAHNMGEPEKHHKWVQKAVRRTDFMEFCSALNIRIIDWRSNGSLGWDNFKHPTQHWHFVSEGTWKEFPGGTHHLFVPLPVALRLFCCRKNIIFLILLAFFIFSKILWDRHYHLHFADEEIEPQRDEMICTCSHVEEAMLNTVWKNKHNLENNLLDIVIHRFSWHSINVC